MNTESSRSHAIFTVLIECSSEDANRQSLRMGKLNLVDLAVSGFSFLPSSSLLDSISSFRLKIPGFRTCWKIRCDWNSITGGHKNKLVPFLPGKCDFGSCGREIPHPLPWFQVDAAPPGFLGRKFKNSHGRLQMKAFPYRARAGAELTFQFSDC